MSEVTEPSDEGTDSEYSIPGDHYERYGREQHQPRLASSISIAWEGSARELIRDDIEAAWQALEPRGCALRCFVRLETRVKVRTFPEAKALYGQMTDELYRRRINDRQRNSIHRVRDELKSQFEDQREAVERYARKYWDGHKYRAEGQIPSPSIPVVDVRLDAEVTNDDFVRSRTRYHLSRRPDDAEVERVVDRLPLMYGYRD